MARGTKKDIPDHTKRLVVHLYNNRHRKQADIACDLQISQSSVEKILRQDGGAVPQGAPPEYMEEGDQDQ
ncbi:hypothetical protein B0H19DRAFT_1148331 [Mycena capillaripes]|nr:hypothetical protein B0H19DRAFT_1148331 [Mycena capillaripes]